MKKLKETFKRWWYNWQLTSIDMQYWEGTKTAGEVKEELEEFREYHK